MIPRLSAGPNNTGLFKKWYPEGFKNAVDYKIDEQHWEKTFGSPWSTNTMDSLRQVAKSIKQLPSCPIFDRPIDM